MTLVGYLVVAASFLGALVGQALQPFVGHWAKHRSMRRALRGFPGGSVFCRDCYWRYTEPELDLGAGSS